MGLSPPIERYERPWKWLCLVFYGFRLKKRKDNCTALFPVDFFNITKLRLLFKLNLMFMNPVHRNTTMKVTNKIQLYRLIYYSYSALHVSGDFFTHHQEHLTVFTVSGSIHPSSCLLVSWMSWNWTMWIVRRVHTPHNPHSSVSTHPRHQPDTRLTIHIVQFQLIQDTSRQLLGWILPDTVNADKCSWWWVKTSPETCRAD